MSRFVRYCSHLLFVIPTMASPPETSSSYWLLLLSCCLALSSPSCQRGVMDPSDNKRLGVLLFPSFLPKSFLCATQVLWLCSIIQLLICAVIVHDGSLRPQLELWMVTALLEDAARIVCSTSSIRVETFRMPTEDLIRGTVHLSGITGGTSDTSLFII